jgi:hypothetical protein
MSTERERIWGSKGCEVCRARWSGPLGLNLVGEPRELGQSDELMGCVAKCGQCATYWTWGFHLPSVIGRDEALRVFPDLDERERGVGLP